MDGSESKREKKHWAAKVLLSKSFIIAVALVITYTLVGFFLAPYLIKRQAACFAEETLQCRLVMEGRYDPASDREALQTMAVRLELARRTGAEPAPGEDPGPVDVDNPLVQKAIEEWVSEKISPEVPAAAREDAGRRAGCLSGFTTDNPIFIQNFKDEVQNIKDTLLEQSMDRDWLVAFLKTLIRQEGG